MKPYGNSRKDNLTCAYGCCTYGTVKTRHHGVALATLRSARKRARQRNRSQITSEVQSYVNDDRMV